MPIKRGVHIWLEVDDTPLQEFKITSETEHRTQCYVPSQEGKRFIIKVNVITPEKNARNIAAYVYLDGISACSSMFSSNAASIRGGRTHLKDYEAPFLFARLRTTDNEDEACQDESRIRELGSIKVKIEWVRVLGEVPFRSEALPQTLNQPVWEGTKKATNAGHSVTFGNWEEKTGKRWFSTERISDIPVCEFVFRYGPIEWLRAEGIAPPLPPPPPPSPPPENRPEPPKKRNRKQVGNERNNNDDNDSALSSVTVKRRPSPIGDGLDSDLDTNSLSPEEEAEYRRLQAKLKASKKLKPNDIDIRNETRSPASKRRKSMIKSESEQDRKPLFPVVRQGDYEYIDLTEEH